MAESVPPKGGKTKQEPENWLSQVICGDRIIFLEVSEWSSTMPGWCGWMVSHMKPVVRAEEQYGLAFLTYFKNLQAVQFAAPVRNGYLPRLCIPNYFLAAGSCGHLSQKPVASLK